MQVVNVQQKVESTHTHTLTHALSLSSLSSGWVCEGEVMTVANSFLKEVLKMILFFFFFFYSVLWSDEGSDTVMNVL